MEYGVWSNGVWSMDCVLFIRLSTDGLALVSKPVTIEGDECAVIGL